MPRRPPRTAAAPPAATAPSTPASGPIDKLPPQREDPVVSDPALLLTPPVALLQEQRYRRHFLAADLRQFAVIALLLELSSLLTLRNDFRLLQGSWMLPVLLLLRGGMAIISVVCLLLLLRRVKRPRRADWILAGYSVLSAATLVAGILSRLPSGEYLGPLGAIGMLLTVTYFALPVPLWLRLLSTIPCTLGLLVVIWNPQAPVSSAARFTWTAVLILLNTIGVLIARSANEQRQRRFYAERKARQAQQQLANKLTELETERRRADLLARARTNFLAAMSHEFRTPMNAVIGLSDLLLAAPPATLSSENRGYVQSISDSARALLTQLNDILDFAKLDAQKLNLLPAPFDLRQLAGSVVGMLRPLAEQRGLLLTLEVSPLVPDSLVSDGARLRQVLVNLISNAIKFTEQGGVRLQLGGQALGPGDYQLSVRVEDSGIGMDAAAVAQLFQPFQQADAGIARKFGGTGLGLTISQQIVRALGGEIVVDSTPGRGSVFAFALRLTAAAAPPQPAPSLVPPPPGPQLPLRILVVDDNPLNLLVARAGLGQLGYPVEQAQSGAEALAAVAAHDYDVIFMDLHMPQMSGTEATVQIGESLAGRPQPHIIAMTASVFEEDRQACFAAGMRDFVDKPVDFRLVAMLLTRVSGERRALLATARSRSPLRPEALELLRQFERRGDKNFVAELCQLFISDTQRRLPELRAALACGDLAAIERGAHRLKSASASVGAVEMSGLCAQVELAARQGQLAALGEPLAALAENFVVVERALAREVLSKGGAGRSSRSPASDPALRASGRST